MNQDSPGSEALEGLAAEISSALRAPVPRTPAQVKLVRERFGKFYRGLGLILWGVIVSVPAVVGFASPGREWSTFFTGLAALALLLGVPVQTFVVAGRRGIAALARTGELRDAVVSSALMRGEPGQQIVEAELDLTGADGNVVILRVSGLPTLPAVGTVYAVLADPASPHVAGVIAPPVGMYIASAQPTAARAATRDSVLEYADLGLRGAAATVDLLVLLGVFIAVSLLERAIFASEPGWLQFALSLGAAFGYFIVMEAQHGWTLGKRLLGLRVVMGDGGGPIGWRASIVRNLWRIVDGIGFYLVAVIVVLVSNQRQRIGDRQAGTVVVRVPKALETGANERRPGRWY